MQINPEPLIKRAEALWRSLYGASKRDSRYSTALNSLESAIAALHEIKNPPPKPYSEPYSSVESRDEALLGRLRNG